MLKLMLKLMLSAATALTLVTGVANAGQIAKRVEICSGKLWNISNNSGETWIEIGHGNYQCTIKVASEAGRKILSVCNLDKRCTIRVELAPQTDEELAGVDDVEITEKDMLSVRPGAADDIGCRAKHSRGC
jgi:hypothetical protein